MRNINTLLGALILAGYPVAGLSATFLGIQSTMSTYPYRAFVFLIALIVLANNIRKRKYIRIDFLLGAFLFFYMIRLLYDWQYAEIEDSNIAVITYFATVLIPIIAASGVDDNLYSDARLGALTYMLTIIAVTMILVAKYMGKTYNPWEVYGIETTRLGFDALNPISVGNIAGISLLCAIYFILESKNKIKNIIPILSILPIVYVLLSANSRGPLISCIVPLVWYFFRNVRNIILITAVAIVLAFFVNTESEIFINITDRFSTDFFSDKSNSLRLLYQEMAISAFIGSPLLGAYYRDPLLLPGEYPHNLVIESAMALGVFGAGAMISMLLRSLLKITIWYSHINPLKAMLAMQTILGASFSGTLWSVPNLFFLLNIVLVARPAKRNKNVE